MYSGPLSQRITTGLPRHPITCSSARLTREAGKEKINLDARCFAVEVVDHIKQPYRAAIAELVMHEDHRPTQVRLVRDSQWLRFGTHQPFLGFYPQIELQRPIVPVYPVVVPAKAFDIVQVQEAKP